MGSQREQLLCIKERVESIAMWIGLDVKVMKTLGITERRMGMKKDIKKGN